MQNAAPPPPPPAIHPQKHADLEGAVSLLVPLKVDGLAMASGYLAILSPLAVVAVVPTAPLGIRVGFVLPAASAVLLGALAVRRIRRTPGARGIFRAWFGIVLPSLFLAFVTAIVIARSS